MAKRVKPVAQPPDDFLDLNVTAPQQKAAGVKGIVTAIQQAAKYMQPTDIVKTTLKLNQKDGLDCPGCAWPDPDDDRSSIAEYCENGIKAIAEEASRKKIDRTFFEQNSMILKLVNKGD